MKYEAGDVLAMRGHPDEKRKVLRVAKVISRGKAVDLYILESFDKEPYYDAMTEQSVGWLFEGVQR